MALRYYANAAKTTLVNAISNADTSCLVVSVSSLPTQFPYTLILDRGTSTEEVVDVTAAVGATLTITRGVDGVVAQAHAAGSAVEHGVSARDPRESNVHVNATTNVHGTTGSLVDTGAVQSITGAKTFTSLSTVAGGAVAALGGTQTVTGDKTFSGSSVFSGSARIDNPHISSKLPLGIVSKALSTANSLNVGTLQTVLGTGGLMTFGRQYRISAYIRIVSSAVSYPVLYLINQTDAVTIGEFRMQVDPVNSFGLALQGSMVYTPPSTATRVYQAQIEPTAGNLQMVHLATSPSWLLIEDIGLVP